MKPLLLHSSVLPLVYMPKYKLFLLHSHRITYYSISLENLSFPFHSIPMTLTLQQGKKNTQLLRGWEICVDLYSRLPCLMWMIYTHDAFGVGFLHPMEGRALSTCMHDFMKWKTYNRIEYSMNEKKGKNPEIWRIKWINDWRMMKIRTWQGKFKI